MADYTTFASTSRRGFTGHEMLDSVGLVHMNGRVYDPLVGRFLSADPIIQTISLSQAINPFSYVMNMPLMLTDPSGYSWIGKIFKSVGHFIKKWGGTIISVAFTVVGMPFVGALLSSMFNMAANGGSFGSFLTGLAISAVAGAIAGPLGGKIAGFVGAAGSTVGARIVAGAITGAIAGGISSAASGGSFWGGFAVGAVTGGLTAGLQAKLGSTPVEGGIAEKFEAGVRDTVGKLWTLPNTAVGLLIGLAGVPFGARMHFQDNAIEFTNYPWGSGGALTIGNVVLYSGTVPDDLLPRYDGTGAVRAGTHERAHTYQYQLLGVLFAPAYFLAPGPFTQFSPFERAADNFADGSGSWWPWKR